LPVLKYLFLINPLVYASEGMRASVTPSVPYMHVHEESDFMMPLCGRGLQPAMCG
jgi:hypothetical protein